MAARGIPVKRTVAAVALLLLALGVNFLWFAPRLQENGELRATQERLAAQVRQQHQAAAQNRAYLRYVTSHTEDSDWVAAYRDADPFSLLDGLRRSSGLSRRDLRLQDQSVEGPFLRTNYFLSLHGTYEQALAFLRAVESTLPVMEVESLVLEQAPEARRVNLRVTIIVNTLGEETAS